MKALSSLIALSIVAVASAQSPLTTQFNGPWGWTGTPSPNTFFNLTINTTVTLQALDVHTDSTVGTIGTIELWITNPGTTTHVGNELTAALWSMASSGPCTSAGTGQPSRACLTTGVVLQPGTRGVAIHYVGLAARFTQGNGTNQTFSNLQMTLQAGSVQAVPFLSATFQPYVWDGAITYANGAIAHSCASVTSYGAGCYTTIGSIYQLFNTSAAATAAALNSRSLSFLNVGTGYVVLPGTAVYIAPSGLATALPANDDGETAVPLTNAFAYPGGSATQLFVHTNGYISIASNNTLPGGNNYQPAVAPFLAAPATAWWSWHDYNAAEVGSGTIKFEEVGSLVLITWQGVESYPDMSPNPSTMQFQFDTTTGQVNIVWVTLTAIGGSTFGDNHLVGCSPGGPSPIPAATNLATLVSQSLTWPEKFPLQLAASPRPVLGNTVNLTTSQETGLNVGINFVGLVQIPAPGIDLLIIGAPGCAALLDPNAAVGNVISNLGLPGLSMTIAFPMPLLPLSLVGTTIYSQSIWLDPSANAFGMTTSNAVTLVVGSF